MGLMGWITPQNKQEWEDIMCTVIDINETREKSKESLRKEYQRYLERTYDLISDGEMSVTVWTFDEWLERYESSKGSTPDDAA